jgi:NADPH:quinone reductase-like Zn-dependent oxidoreductase
VPGDIPGMELAGEVIESRAPVPRFEPGARVMAIVAGAAQAELAVVDERQLMPVPDALDWTQAGGFPEVYATAYDALVGQAKLRSGQRLLVNGAGGGVGTAAVQLGRVLGADVTASVRNEKNRAAVEELGANRALSPDEAFEHGPFDVILELVGGPNLADNVKSLATWGTIVVIGVSAGPEGTVDLLRLMAKRGTLRASTLRYRSPEEKALLARELETSVLPLIADGRLRVPVEAEFPLAEVTAAYERFTAGGHVGKIVLRCD